jgi:hypothetical protein
MEDHDTLRTIVEIVGFYFCYISVSYFWASFLLHFVNQGESILKLLPSTVYREGLIGEMGRDEEMECNLTDMTLNGTCGEEDIDWYDIDSSFIYSNVAKLSYYNYIGSDEKAALMTLPVLILTYVVAGAASMYGLSRLGFAFIGNW